MILIAHDLFVKSLFKNFKILSFEKKWDSGSLPQAFYLPISSISSVLKHKVLFQICTNVVNIWCMSIVLGVEMLNMCKALDSQDKPHKCYMSLACCHEMLKESRCIYVDKVKVFTEPIHSSYNLQLLPRRHYKWMYRYR